MKSQLWKKKQRWTKSITSGRSEPLLLSLIHISKLPIYAFFTAAFFPDHGAIVMIALYFGGIIMGILMALLMRKTLFSGEAVPFVMELPNYRMPGAKNVGHLLWDKAKDFLQRAFTVIFMATLVIWFLQTFNTHLSIVTDSKDSKMCIRDR